MGKSQTNEQSQFIEITNTVEAAWIERNRNYKPNDDNNQSSRS